MKVSVADIANEHKAGPNDVASLPTGHQAGIFASLLDLNDNGSDVTQGTDGTPRKQGGRSKEKNDNESQPLAPGRSIATATLNSVSPSMIADVASTQWRLDTNGTGVDSVGSEKIPLGSRTGGAGAPAAPIYASAIRANTRTIDIPTLKIQQAPQDDAAEPALSQNLNDPEVGALPKSAHREPDIEVTRAQTSSSGSSAPLTSATSPPSTSATVPQSTGPIDTGRSSFSAQANLDTALGIPVVSRRTTPEDTKPTGGSEGPTSDPSSPPSGPSAENRGGPAGLHAPSQAVSSLSSSMAGGRQDQDSADGAHRGGVFDEKRVVADTRSSAPEKPPSALGVPAPGDSLQGHSAVLNSNHSESVREATSNTQFKELGSGRADENAARLLGSAMRGDLRIGVQTEAFGHVTIQTTAQGGQLSAQLSLENAKECATLAAHLPTAEHRLAEQHGVTASVRLAPGSGGAGGGFSGREQSGSNRGDSGPYGVVQARQMQHNTSNEDRGVEAALMASRYFVTSRLDVTV